MQRKAYGDNVRNVKIGERERGEREERERRERGERQERGEKESRV
jgi:hypothetical protein